MSRDGLTPLIVLAGVGCLMCLAFGGGEPSSRVVTGPLAAGGAVCFVLGLLGLILCDIRTELQKINTREEAREQLARDYEAGRQQGQAKVQPPPQAQIGRPPPPRKPPLR